MIKLKLLKPCWILCTPRSGSTYLASILNDTLLFDPIFSEYLGWKKKLILNPNDIKLCPKFCKVLHVHMNRIFYKPDFLQDIPINHNLQYLKPPKVSVEVIKKYFPNIKFVLLERKDCVAQAISYCVTSEVSNYHKQSFFNISEKNKYLKFKNTKINVSDDNLMKYYETCKKYKDIWSDFLLDVPHFKLYYEEITEKKITELLNFLGCKTSNVNLHVKNTYKATSDRNDFYILKQRLHAILHKHQDRF